MNQKLVLFKKTVENLIQEMLVAIARFPLPALFAAVMCAICIDMSHNHAYKDRDLYMLSLTCGILIFVTLKLFSEAKKWKAPILYIIGLPIFAAIYWYLDHSNLWIVFGFLFPGLVMLMFASPYLLRSTANIHIWTFITSILIRLLVTAVASAVLFTGLSAIYGSFGFLFNIKVSHHLYTDTGIIIWTIFSTLVALAGVPKNFNDEKTEFPNAVRVIMSYIAIPLLAIYTLILYAYTTKIIITWNLPEGGVAYLVSAFGCYGIIVFLGINPLFKSQGLISLFEKYFFKVLTVPAALFAVGIYTRVKDYGFTEQRYAITLCFVWFVLCCVYAFVRRSGQSIRFVILSVGILFTLSSFGPWGAVQVSSRSQIKRLNVLFVKNNIAAGVKVAADDKIDCEDIKSIRSIIQYFVFSEKKEALEKAFPNFTVGELGIFRDYQTTDKIMDSMGLAKVQERCNVSNDSNYFSVTVDESKPIAMPVSGYDYTIDIQHYSYSKEKAPSTEIDKNAPGSKLSFNFDTEKSELLIQREDDKGNITLNLQPMLEQFKNSNDKYLLANDPRLVIEGESETMKVKLIVKSISTYSGKEKNTKINNIAGKVLLKLK